MESVIFAILFIVVIWAMVARKYYGRTRNGQRMQRKQALKREIRQGMRDAEINDGLWEEAVEEVLAKEQRKRGLGA